MNNIKASWLYHIEIIGKLDHKKYYYMDTLEFLNLYLAENASNPTDPMYIYWSELLMRAHYASVTSLMRSERWIRGIVSAIDGKNYILFASALRGLLESVSDSYYSLLSKPTDIACNFSNIKKAINHSLDRPLYSKSFEESLLHYQYASKSNKANFEYEKALNTSKYINLFDKGSDLKSKKLYSELCEIVHPASSSVNCFSKNMEENNLAEYRITSNNLDEEHIELLMSKYKEEIDNILKISISLPAFCLKMINLLEFEPLKSDYISSCKIDDCINDEAWEKILDICRTTGGEKDI